MFFTLSKALTFLIHPLFYFWVLFFVFLLKLRKKQPLFRTLFLMMSYLALIASPAPQLLVKSWEERFPPILEPAPVDAIVVLNGGSIYLNELTHQYILGGAFPRFLEGARLFNSVHAKYIVASGGDPFPLPSTIKPESASYAQWLTEIGISRDSIIIEDRSLNTFQEAVNLKEVFREKKIESFYLVTSAMHMSRSMAVFQKQGFRPLAYPVDFLNTPLTQVTFSLSNIELLHQFLHEFIGMLAYTRAGYL